jgi:uncharacterized membrane protein
MELLILRVLHIFSGVFWAGSVIYVAAFIFPALKTSGPDGARFMQNLMRTNRLPLWLSLAPIVNVLVGLRLMDVDSGHFSSAWISSPYGMTLFIGGIIAIIAFLVGLMVNMPSSIGMNKIAAEIGGNPPTTEQIARITKLRNRLKGGTIAIALLLSLTTILMSMAKYISAIA